MKRIKGSTQPDNKNKRSSRLRALQLLLVGGTLLAGGQAAAQNNAPVFTRGPIQSFAICQNAPAASVDTLLRVFDADAGQTERWFGERFPMHGTLSGVSISATSTGDTIMPSGLTYVPDAGYSGPDTFVVLVSDGIDSARTLVAITVKPLPTLTSSRTPPSICDQDVFSYIPTSGISGTTFAWSRAFTGGISNPSGTGTGDPFEALYNSTYYTIPVTYVYMLRAAGCSNPQSVVVNVRPTPRLSTPLYDTICSGGSFAYTPMSFTTGTTFAWARAAVAGIAPGASSGSGSISETLTNTTPGALTAVYTFALEAAGCTSARNVNVTVVPASATTSITVHPSASLCMGTRFQNFGAGETPGSGISYSWSAVNATIDAVGSTTQYCLVSFPNAGAAQVMLSASISSAHCVVKDTFDVNVGTGSMSTARIIYYGTQFVYQDNTAESYQWGYDDAASLAPSVITDATFQSYPMATSPDFTNRYYWVMVSKGGCSQKVYYNAPMPAAVASVNAAPMIAVYPNPAATAITVKTGATSNDAAIVIADMTGHAVLTTVATTTSTSINIAGLPAGCYMVHCIENGIRTATTKFTKN